MKFMQNSIDNTAVGYDTLHFATGSNNIAIG